MLCRRRNLMFLVPLVLFAASGANCRPMVHQPPNMPRQLPAQPTLEQVVDVVNRNSMQIQSFSTSRATLRVSGSPSIPATIAMHRPGRFRMRADTALSAGPELDLGSNDALFWFWYRGDPGNVYFCPHDRFATSEAARVVPIAPAELIDALGLATLDPALPHQGPFARPDGMLEIRTIRDTIDGPITKITVVHPYGWIVEQHFHDARGQTVFRTIAQQHRRDPASGLIMPRIVDVDCPPSGFRMRIDLGNVEINTLPDGALPLWEMPRYAGARLVDLSDPDLRFPQTSASRIVAPSVTTSTMGTTTAVPTNGSTWRQLSR